MEAICQIGQINTKLEDDIQSLEASIDSLSVVYNSNLCWRDSVVFSVVLEYLSEAVELKKAEKERNKQQMTDILLQHLQQ